ncbi:3-deoxy-7-phosphoheptulonate synthase [Ereboglobus sp. PH5-10]|uniref:3-deoxy-7-phosphoheptulonate synthase n=1 Tax=Ereboglobus sp. PH5-10 TaxID=2940629 RepID=UPI002406DA99|nr:3-deoxy-7-phosphoheptulonate synthase [Ereboglobus sp. PH5-10]MDF9826675.1 3-deoxy-7-phosphoheptulonate synthase [Ereboglobus sp. PH5-10]
MISSLPCIPTPCADLTISVTHDERRAPAPRISYSRALLPPAVLIEELALSPSEAEFVTGARAQIGDILKQRDDRLLVIAGPCSIHDTEAALEYARRLAALGKKHGEDLFVVMRAYFEKPRTVAGWKGLINDPYIDNSFRINDGLRIARQLLRDMIKTGVPAATEFLDTIIMKYIADMVCYGAIGARTSQSQVHRELASGLPMPVGFKNDTTGSVQIAVDALGAAKRPHWFPSVADDGAAAVFNTTGNPDAHLILRGGARTGVNYKAGHIADATALLANAGHPGVVVVDCSHGNSEKDHRRQPAVAADLARQVAAGTRAIAGVMLESHLREGRQDKPDKYGVSITDACISFEQTEPILEQLAGAVRSRRKAVAGMK